MDGIFGGKASFRVQMTEKPEAEAEEDECYTVAVHLRIQEIGISKKGECLLRNLAA